MKLKSGNPNPLNHDMGNDKRVSEPLKPCPFKGPFKLHASSEILDSENRLVCVVSNFSNSESIEFILDALDNLNEAWNRHPQSPPVAQVEVYRKALDFAPLEAE